MCPVQSMKNNGNHNQNHNVIRRIFRRAGENNNSQLQTQLANGCWDTRCCAQLCPTLLEPLDCSPPGSSVHGDSPGKKTGVGCRALLQGIFPTQELNLGRLCLLHWQVGSLPLAPPGNSEIPGDAYNFLNSSCFKNVFQDISWNTFRE